MEMTYPKIIFYDCETTGLNPYHDEIIELAAVDQNGNKYNELFKPKKQSGISEFIENLTKITNKMVKNKPHFEDAYDSFLDFIGRDSNPVYLIAHNQDFDKMFLKKYLKKDFNPNWRLICTCISVVLYIIMLYFIMLCNV